MQTQAPDFLVVGHICHDKLPGGFQPGGAAAYAGLTGMHLGFRTAVLSSYGDDFLFGDLFQAMELFGVPAPHTTIFENIYENGQRRQFLHQRASLLSPAHLPQTWRSAKTVLLGPICDEVDLEFLHFFNPEKTTVIACPQGWMRRWDDKGRVSVKPFENWELLRSATLVSMSENDVGCNWDLIEQIAGKINILAVTQGRQGATVFRQGRPQHFPSLPAWEEDPTGAGDVFAAAFSLHFTRHKNLEEAVQFANAVAARSVEKKGLESTFNSAFPKM